MANEPVNTNETNTEQTQTESTGTAELEARIKALEAENGKLRQANTNASADASKWKKQYQDKLSDEEKAKAAQEEATTAMRNELEQLRNERNIANYSATLTAPDIGMDTETAKSVAEALNAGNTEEVFKGIRTFITAHDKALKAEGLKNNQTLPGGSSEKVITQAEFDNMSYREMLALKTEHPELYKQFTQ